MALPLNLLYHLQITLRQKAGLASVFALGAIVIVVAIVRASQIGGRLRSDSVLLTVWSLIESTICTYYKNLRDILLLLAGRSLTHGL